MKTISFQTQSPPNFGASFTEHTNQTLLTCYDYLFQSSLGEITYAQLQGDLSKKFQIKESNFRCIIPLAKDFNLVSSIERNEFFKRNQFFTDCGIAYINMLKQIKKIQGLVFPEKEKVLVAQKQALSNIFLLGLISGLRENVDWSDPMKVFFVTLNFLYEFSSIDKMELAFLWYHYKEDEHDYLKNMSSDLLASRNGNAVLTPTLIAQKDMGLASKTEIKDYDKVSPGYSYIMGTLEQCGLVKTVKKTSFLIENKRSKVKEIINRGK